MRRKFVAAVNIPSPYRVYLWREVCKQLNARGIDFELHIMSRGHRGRPQNWRNPVIDYPHRYWNDYGRDCYHFNPGMILHLWRHQPDWLFCSSPYDTLTGALLLTLCRKSCRIAWQETNTKTPGKLDGLVGWFKRSVLTKVQFIGVPGSDATKQMAMHQERTKRQMPPCVFLPNLVDGTRFAPVDMQEKAQLRRDLFGISSDCRLCLIPARLSAVKGLVPFVKLLDPELLDGWRIVIMGQGPLKDELLAAIAARGLSDKISVLDYMAYAQMPGCYAASDLVLLPSLYDPNPLTSVEALHTGLPLALSCMAGNVEEAVTPGKNGWVLPVNDPVAFKDVLRDVFGASVERLVIMGKYSKEHNSRFWDTPSSIAKFLDQIGARNA